MATTSEQQKPGFDQSWRDRLSRLLWWLPFGPVPEISPVDLNRRMNGGSEELQLLDVRSSVEFRQLWLTGAINIPITSLPGSVDCLPLDKCRMVVVICATAHRSIPAVRLLRRRGFQDVRQLAGGIVRWRSLKLPAEFGTDWALS